MLRLSDMRQKEVVNIDDGTRIGLIYDFEIDLNSGDVSAIIIPGEGKILNFFGKSQDLIIPWENIIKIGTDIILVDLKYSRK
ncbi:YlmC/YmxH family sporulation protein [Sporanaerobacter sp. PP17-6a]|jgi:YlmC/YmxH family sporulation protein|uniref:YlmC/YmxH family sporulation protein n=1 Tax=Sporanaerobacter sp. PP17-6a TaxID=1891289 RepID=UPI00089FC2C5|nr:YlmC/YmxH family sporulation protein [Sporanaerobacter sp. PP17-6a]MBE6081895.1 YlmC/YmxH family sporulation protein [Tissierellaceae bacterium]SCL84860.1 sporulation protein, YlmC/YmxH family [Sporanaerobacter sp. PP17-6a]